MDDSIWSASCEAFELLADVELLPVVSLQLSYELVVASQGRVRRLQMSGLLQDQATAGAYQAPKRAQRRRGVTDVSQQKAREHQARCRNCRRGRGHVLAHELDASARACSRLL